MSICPPDLYKQLQERISKPERYNHLLAKTLHDLCNAIQSSSIIWVDGVAYSYDPVRQKQLSTNRPTLVSGFYGANQKSRYLRMQGVTTSGNSGFLLPRDAVITGMWAKSRSIAPWTFEIRKNDVPITLSSVNVVSSIGSDLSLNIDLDAGDFVQFYMSGDKVDHPIVSLELAWRI